jgi:5-methylcytosine-specific restriction endonuclease McrA
MPHRVNSKFCSAKCRDDHRRKSLGKNNPSYRRISIPCPICSAVFDALPSLVKKGKAYCSPQCGRESRRRKLLGKGRPKTNTTAFHNTKQIALERDGKKCRICGFDQAVHVHHITPKSKIKDKTTKHHPSNLITLCPNHHAMAHSGLLNENELRLAIAA